MTDIVQRLLTRLVVSSGRDIPPHADLSIARIGPPIMQRVRELIRGVIRLRRRVFLGARVSIRGRRSIAWGAYVRIGDFSEIDGSSRTVCSIGDHTSIGAYARIVGTPPFESPGGGFRIGARVGIGDHCHIGTAGGVEIGDGVIAGSYVSFHAQNHIFHDPHTPIRDQGTIQLGIFVGPDCWLGAKVTVLDGSRIGAGSVVAAGAVVNGQFPPYSVLAGVPARVVAQRGKNS